MAKTKKPKYRVIWCRGSQDVNTSFKDAAKLARSNCKRKVCRLTREP